MARPPKAMIDPVSRQIGIISRLRKRSRACPLSRCTTSPLLNSSASAKAFLAAAGRAVRAPRRVADPKLLDRLRRQRRDRASSRLARRARRPGQLLAEIRRRDLVHLQQRFTLALRLAILPGVLGFRQRSSRHVRRAAGPRPGMPTLSYSSTNLKTSPPTPQPKQ